VAPCHREESRAQEVEALVEDLLLGQRLARHAHLNDGDVRCAVAQDERRVHARREDAQQRLADRRGLRHGRLDLRPRVEEDLDVSEAVHRLRFDVLDVVDVSGERPLADRDDALLDLVRRDAGIGPDDADDGNVDLGQDVLRHRHDAEDPDQHDDHGADDEGVRASQRQTNDPHRRKPPVRVRPPARDGPPSKELPTPRQLLCVNVSASQKYKQFDTILGFQRRCTDGGSGAFDPHAGPAGRGDPGPRGRHQVQGPGHRRRARRLRAAPSRWTRAAPPRITAAARSAPTKASFPRRKRTTRRPIEIDPKFAKAWFGRALLRTYTNNEPGAMADFTKAVEADPAYTLAWFNRALLRLSRKDYDGAVADYTKAIDLKPQDADGYIGRGNAYASKGDHDKAIADYSKAIDLKPASSSAYVYKGDSQMKKGDPIAAMLTFSKAIEVNPKDAEAYYFRGFANYDRHAFKEAGDDFKKALRAEPPQRNPHRHAPAAALARDGSGRRSRRGDEGAQGLRGEGAPRPQGRLVQPDRRIPRGRPARGSIS